MASNRLKPRAKSIIFLHQFGGPSHIDTFDMKPNAPDGIRGSFKPISSSVPGLNITEHLPRWAKVMHRCTLVRSVHHHMKNHNSAAYYSLTGHAPPVDDIRLRDTQELYPAYGSVATKFVSSRDPAFPPFISLPYLMRDGSVTPGQAASFLGKMYDPFFIQSEDAKPDFKLPELDLPDSLSLERLQSRRELLKFIDAQSRTIDKSALSTGIGEFYHRAFTTLFSPKVKQVFDLSAEPTKVREEYGMTKYGQSCLLARRLVEAGVPFVSVYFSNSIGGKGFGGWDTHQNNFVDLADRLLPMTDRTVPTLIADLAQRGMLESTLVVWMGEFGRGPKIGDRDGKGRNHWPHCYTVLFAGGGMRPGAIYGKSDRTGAYPAENPVRLEDIAATMFYALGIDPKAEVRDNLGRPLAISAGDPVTALFS